MMVQKRVWISGRVQGVGFRFSTFEYAKQFSDLKGYVRNLPDGRVEALFAGPEEVVGKMIEWAKKGPQTARVERMEVVSEDVSLELSIFSIC